MLLKIGKLFFNMLPEMIYKSAWPAASAAGLANKFILKGAYNYGIIWIG